VPTRAPRTCGTPGCRHLITTRAGRCDGCRRRAETARGTRQQRGYDDDWDRFATGYLHRHPWCAGWPAGTRCGQRATVVDHVIPLRSGGPRFDERNLRPLCTRHHNQRTGTDSPGGVARR
jgi:5-methylcytosine-specific restriction protein A